MKLAPWFLGLVCLVCAADARATTPTTTEGHLLTQDHGKVVDVPLDHTDVAIRVDGFLVDATVTQRFKNPYPTKIEAVYLFPLPTGAAVTEMSLTSGTHVIHGAIQERAKATAVYEAARAAGHVAALLTQERPNLFTQSVTNLEPADVIEVTLHYVQRLPYAAGGYELVFPMVAGARYVPAGSTADAVQQTTLPAGLRSSHDIALSVEVDAGVPIEDVTSPSHRIVVARPGPSRASIHLAPGDTVPNKDFVLHYQTAGQTAQLGALAYKPDARAPGSLLLIAQPPALPAAAQIAPRELVFVLDTSSSMRGAPLAKAKELIAEMLVALRPDDTFQIVRFDDTASVLGAAPVANKPRNIDLTLKWLGALEATGTTEMTSGIAAALAVPHDPARLRIVAFITDGYVGNEDAILRTVAEHAGASRLFAFGIGSAVNRYLLEEMAAAGRGAAQFVRPDANTHEAVAAFRARLDTPVLTDLAVDWGGLAVTDVTPHAVPDLFAGQPLVLAAHYAHAGSATIIVRGKQAGRPVELRVPVTLPEVAPDRPAIATVWARERIAELSRQLTRADDPAREHEILELSLANHLLTRYTAFVAVDMSRTTAGGAARKVAVPVEVPEAVRGVTSGFGSGGGGTGWGTIGVGSYGTIGHGSGMGTGYGGSISHHAAVPDLVVIGQPIVVGTLDAAIVRRYIKRNLEKIRYCYEKQLLAKPTLAGTVTTRFVIDANGSVVTVVADGMADTEVTSCVASVVRAIEFPKVPGGDPIQITYPFIFKGVP